MIEFDTPLTDREKLIALIASCFHEDMGVFYLTSAVNIKLAGIKVEDGAMDDVIHDALIVTGNLYNEIRLKRENLT